MDYLKKTIAGWEVKYGQIAITGNDYQIAIKLLEPYIGKPFTLETFKGLFHNRNFNHKSEINSLRIACKQFFGELQEGDEIYFKPIDSNKLGVYATEPKTKTEKKEELGITEKINHEELLSHLYALSKENKQLREVNDTLFEYKNRLEKYQRLEYIFEDEKFMENWLERNIHKAVAQLEIIDRQPSIHWKEGFMRDRPDFFCVDKTTRELVIVENKVRGRHRNVDTQYLKYRTWALRHLNIINEKYQVQNIRATPNFKFVIITDTTDERLEAICEDNNIALILIDGGVVFEEIVPYYLNGE